MCAGDPAAPRAFLTAATDAAAAAGLELRRRAAEQLLRSGDLEGGLALTDEVLRAVGLRRPRSRRGTLAATVARRAQLAARGLGFVERAADRIDPRALARVDVLASAASGLTFVDPLVGTYFQTRQLIEALRAGDLRRAAYALALEVGFRATAGEPGRVRAQRIAATARALAERTGDPGLMGLTVATTALIYFQCGNFPGALPLLVEAERMLRENPTPYRWQRDLVQIYLASTLAYLGRLRALSQSVPLLLRDALDHGDRNLADALRAWRSNTTWLVLDDPAEARRQLAAARHDRAGGFHLHDYYVLHSEIQIDLYEGDGERAWQRLEGAWAALGASMLLRVQIVRIEANFLRGRAALATCATADPDRLALVDAHAAALDREHLPWSDALAAILRSRAASRRGPGTGATPQLERAAAAADAAGLHAFAAAVRWRGGERRGGRRGDAIRRAAHAWFEAENVQRPERFVAMLAP